jgi:HEAT repeats
MLPNAFAPSDMIDPDAPKPNRMANAFTPARAEPAAGGPGVFVNNIPNNRPSGPGQLPAAPFSGPTYPAGTATAGYQQPGMMPPQNTYMPVGHQQVVMAPRPMPMAAAAADTKQMMQTLKDALLPSQRERAAEQLCQCDATQNPHVVQALAAAAKNDPAPAVRACCVHGLTRMMADPTVVAKTVECLKSDNDPRVQKAVQQAAASLPHGMQSVQPAGFQVPAK